MGDSNEGNEEHRRLSDAEKQEIIRDVLANRKDLAGRREELRAAGFPVDSLIARIDKELTDVRRMQVRADRLGEVAREARAALDAHTNKVALLVVQFAMEFEKRWPELREQTPPEKRADAEAYLADWRDNREQWLAPLTPDQRRELGF